MEHAQVNLKAFSKMDVEQANDRTVSWLQA